MRVCSCCCIPHPVIEMRVMLDHNRGILWACNDCLDFLWHKRNPDARAQWKAGKVQRKADAQQERAGK